MAKATARKPTPVEKKLVGVADVVIAAAGRSRDPALSIPVRSLANINFNEKRGIIEMGRRRQERTFFNVGMAKKFMQTVLVADALAELQRANLTTSLREIYYRTKHTMKDSHENTFDNQNESDPLIEDLEVTLAALREELHVRAVEGRQAGEGEAQEPAAENRPEADRRGQDRRDPRPRERPRRSAEFDRRYPRGDGRRGAGVARCPDRRRGKQRAAGSACAGERDEESGQKEAQAGQT